MAYDKTVECYYDVVLDIAKQRSSDIFCVIAEAVADPSILEDMSDLIEEWQSMRKTIIDELR